MDAQITTSPEYIKNALNWRKKNSSTEPEVQSAEDARRERAEENRLEEAIRASRGARESGMHLRYSLEHKPETLGGNQFRGSGIEDGREKLVLPRFAREGREGKRTRRGGGERCSKSRRDSRTRGRGGDGGTKEGQIILAQDDTRQPPLPSGVATFVR